MNTWSLMPAIILLATIAPNGTDADPSDLYVALGDSVAFGVGASARSNGYVSLIEDYLELDCHESSCSVERLDLSVPGATTSSLLSWQLPVAAAVIGTLNGDDDPTNDVRLVTLDIGGNDVYGLLDTCRSGLTSTCIVEMNRLLKTLALRFGVIGGVLREAAGDDTPIVIMTYYNPLPACVLSPLAPLGELVLEGGGVIAAGLNDVIRAAALKHDLLVAETYDKLETSDLVGGADCLHPDDSGHRVIADQFLRELAAR